MRAIVQIFCNCTILCGAVTNTDNNHTAPSNGSGIDSLIYLQHRLYQIAGFWSRMNRQKDRTTDKDEEVNGDDIEVSNSALLILNTRRAGRGVSADGR